MALFLGGVRLHGLVKGDDDAFEAATGWNLANRARECTGGRKMYL
jgi:hypothetical protein